MPPSPILAVTEYGPRVVPGSRDISVDWYEDSYYACRVSAAPCSSLKLGRLEWLPVRALRLPLRRRDSPNQGLQRGEELYDISHRTEKDRESVV